MGRRAIHDLTEALFERIRDAIERGELPISKIYWRNDMSDQKASVGRMVHYRESADGPCLTATIAKVLDEEAQDINIGYLSEHGGQRQEQGIMPGEGARQYHWPERI